MGVIRRERGWAGHFIAGDRCEFHRNTLLQWGDQRIIVSTVGKMKVFLHGEMEFLNKKFNFKVPSLSGSVNGYEQIGVNRFYETMVFLAEQQCDEDIYWHINVKKEVSFDSKWAVTNIGLLSDYEADEMHDNVVKEISEKMMSGTIKLVWEE